jgi:hypothetical protein
MTGPQGMGPLKPYLNQVPSLIGFPSTQATGAGTNTVNLGYPSGIQDGDVVVVVCRKDDPWGTLPSGFTEKQVYTYFSPNNISVVTGIYDLATHGSTFSVSYAGGGSGLTRAILWAVRDVDDAVGGFATNTDNGNDKFYPTLVTPAGNSIGFCFGFGGASMTDEQLNGWTDDWGSTTGTDGAFSKAFSAAGSQTMPRWDNIANVSMVSFYLN